MFGKHRCPFERSNGSLQENKRLALRNDRPGFVMRSLLQVARIFRVAPEFVREF